MGCLCSSPVESNKQFYSLNADNQAARRTGQRQPESPADAEQRRILQLEAAEKRQQQNLTRGVQDVTKIKAVQESRTREEWIGRITEQYQRRGLEVPLGLNLASLQTLKEHYDKVTKLRSP
jgi:Small VCP/p97-interacting protein